MYKKNKAYIIWIIILAFLYITVRNTLFGAIFFSAIVMMLISIIIAKILVSSLDIRLDTDKSIVERGNKAYFNIGVDVAGKTGTAQQSSSHPNHALFVSYAPYENPEISVTVRIVNGYSSDYAAQFTRDIIKYYYGLAEEDDLITGTADSLDNAVSNEM